jgi:hypothetical protein
MIRWEVCVADTIYNWGREHKILVEGHAVKVPTQKLVTESGLKSVNIPVYEPPTLESTLSRGFLEYDPLGRT